MTTRAASAPRPRARAARRRSLSVASECVPLVKTGGLADVVGALPRALAESGWDQRVLVPAYPGVLDAFDALTPVWHDDDLFGGPAAVLAGRRGDVEFLLLDAPHCFARPGGIYGGAGGDHPDNPRRFAALSWAASRIALHGTGDGWRPDLVHAHDWQAGFTPSYLRYAGSDVPSVFTVHNIAFQGIAPADQIDELRLPTWDFHPGALEYHGLLSSLKAGIVHADAVTTVSPTYARELTTPQLGFGMEGVVAWRGDRFTGILNGIDTEVWDPGSDRELGRHYTVGRMAGKRVDRQRLLERFGLPDLAGPLVVIVSRLTYHKGIDLVPDALPPVLDAGGGLVVLGSGDPDQEHRLRGLAAAFPDRVGVHIGYDEPLSHLVIAGGDAILVPSRFEPCGLTQLYGLRYGTLPVVAATGGLVDSVRDATPETIGDHTATGFVAAPDNSDSLRRTLRRVVDCYRERRVWAGIRRTAMAQDVGWGPSARRYAALYDAVCEKREEPEGPRG